MLFAKPRRGNSSNARDSRRRPRGEGSVVSNRISRWQRYTLELPSPLPKRLWFAHRPLFYGRWRQDRGVDPSVGRIARTMPTDSTSVVPVSGRKSRRLPAISLKLGVAKAMPRPVSTSVISELPVSHSTAMRGFDADGAKIRLRLR
jgi:hypothetical protein